MGLNDSQNTAALSGATVGGALANLAAAISGWFEVTQPAQRDELAHRAILVLIMCIGAYARFFALGHVGFHGDEETMALAVRHILQDGTPVLPGGMFYPRGITQLYLMAASASVFGMSEWSLRLPSAIFGVLLIPLLYLAGKRFLRPQWNLALAGAAAFLPEIIEYSQTARMYIFLLVSVAAALVCIFEWERTGRLRWLIGAVCSLVLGLDYQALAVTMICVFAFPGLLRGSVSKLLWGAGAAIVVGLAYVVINHFVMAQYPHTAAAIVRTASRPIWYTAYADHGKFIDFALWGIGVALVWVGLYAARAVVRGGVRRTAAVLLFAGVLAQLLLWYHIAFLLDLAAFVLIWRNRNARPIARLMLFVACAMVLAIIHVALIAGTSTSVVKLVGALVGKPSVWPYVRMADFSKLGALLVAASLLWGVWDLAQTRRAKDFALFAALTVWLPIFMLGFFTWNMPARYAAASLDSILLCAVACAQHVFDFIRARWFKGRELPRLQPVTAALAMIAIVEPAHARDAIDATYARYPDHKGAADFIQSQHPGADDVILAEDVLEQTYYLGSVNYWLIGPHTGALYSRQTPDGWRDIYTGTPVMSTSAELLRLLAENPHRRVFIIGSGEEQSDGRRFARGDELSALLDSDLFETIYLGRDRLTRVMRPARDAAFSQGAVAKALDHARQPVSSSAADLP